MKSIWKWPLEITDSQLVMMPDGAQILHVREQYDKPCLWALVDTRAPAVPRAFRTYGTGHPMPDDPGTYIGTYIIRGGELVFHLFEMTV